MASLETSVVVEDGETASQSPEELFHQVLDQLPENMRLYHELKRKESGLYDALQSHRGKLADIDVGAPIQAHPPEVARDALKVYLADRKLTALKKEMGELNESGEWYNFLALYRREIAVRPLGDSRINKFYDLTYTGSTGRAKKGRIDMISLTPSNGGSIEFKSGLRAYPLFDAETFEPQYEIELL